MHTSVLLNEVLGVLNPRPGQIFIDATVNGGGHARVIAEKVGEKGKVIGIDWDCELVRESGIRNQELGIRNTTFVCDTYVNIGAIARKFRVAGKVDGVLFDLGFSSYHTERSGRGFTFLKDEPLDMRYNIEGGGLTAETIVNSWAQDAIEESIRRFGEDHFSKKIAAAIVAARKEKRVTRTAALADIVRRAIPARARGNRIHPATRTFQALRIAVNKELENIEAGLDGAYTVLKKGGVIAAISFHSLEDRIVKEAFRAYEKRERATRLTKKPIIASYPEVRENPRARSAKLRALKKIE